MCFGESGSTLNDAEQLAGQLGTFRRLDDGGKVQDAAVRIYGQLPLECFEVMDRYQPSIPTAQWERIREFVMDAAAVAAPQCAYTEGRLLTMISGYVDWAHNQAGFPLDARIIFRRELINRYYNAESGRLAAGTLRNYRSGVLRVAEILTPEASPMAMRPLTTRATYPPYSSDTLLRFRTW